ncbi:probable transcriptional regulator SLK2 [Hibiscus syriacus]|uniref:probable transcriptional regulator SLK2 n=1 Tax=Hibiscus syriacus TaxID=106335 RepID=UPI0019246109|nr:probable transcriptional regulator SLK2 [Hibiscus syriacus]XP_038994181.1 probable transcriptional regulator SLK2 [Hibiscus syriacus]
MEQLANAQGLPTDKNTLNNLMALRPGINNPMGTTQQMDGRGTLSGSAQAALALSNYQNMLSRRNSMNSNPNSLNQEASSSFNNSNQSPSSNFLGPATVLSGSMQILPISGLSSPHLPTQQQQQLTVSGNNLIQKNHPQPFQGNQVLQQQMI